MPIDNPPQDPVEGQIAIGSDGSFNWFANGSWQSIDGIQSTVGNVPQDVVEGQIAIGNDGSFHWYTNGIWYTAPFIPSTGTDFPQDGIRGQIATSTVDSSFHWLTDDIQSYIPPPPPPPVVPKKLLAAGPTGIYYSDDGINWTESDDNSQWNARGQGYEACVYSPNVGWISGGGTERTPTQSIITSPDGVTWTYRPSPWDGIAGTVGLTYSPSLDLIVIASNYSSVKGIMTSHDGITWTERSSPWDFSGEIMGVTWIPFLNKFFLAAFSDSSDVPGVAIFGSSSDGITWTQLSTPGNPPHHTGAPFRTAIGMGFAHSGNLMMAMGDLDPTQNILTSPDGITFTEQSTVPSPIPTGADTYDGAYHDGVWVVGTNLNGKEILKSTDNGVTWVGIYDAGSTGLSWVQKIIWSPSINKFVAVGGGGVTTSPDGSTWTDVTDPDVYNSVLHDVWDVLAT